MECGGGYYKVECGVFSGVGSKRWGCGVVSKRWGG